MTRTRTIAGHTFTLEAGKNYIASRPWSERGRTAYPVTITANTMNGYPIATVPGLSYDAANALLEAFNNGPSSFAGRIW